MKNQSKSSDRSNGKGGREPNLFGKFAACFNTPVLKFIIEKEIDKEVLRARKDALQSKASSRKKDRPVNTKSCTPGSTRKNKKGSKKGSKTAKELPTKSLPKVLTMEGLASHQKNSTNFFDTIQSELKQTKVALRRLLIPNQRDLLLKAELSLAMLEERITACQNLISNTSVQERHFTAKAQNARQAANKLALREAKQATHSASNIKQLTEANHQAERLESTVAQYKKLESLRLPLLQNRHEKLEKEIEELEKQINITHVKIRTLNTQRTNSILQKSNLKRNARTEAIKRWEQRVCALEEKLTEALDINGGIIKISPLLFEEPEKKIHINEEAAKASLEAIANLPPVETKLMTAEQAKKALAEYQSATSQTTNSFQSLELAGEETRQLILITLKEAALWQSRKSDAEGEGDSSKAQRAEQRAKSKIDSISDLEHALEMIDSTKEPLLKRIEEMNLVSLKLAERLKEIESNTKEKQADEKDSDAN